MNENIDLTKILKDCPKGWKLYSSVYGEVKFNRIDEENPSYPIAFITKHDDQWSVTANGKYYKQFNGECTLFPSKDQRDWSKFTASWYKKDKFNPKTLKPYDKVLGRDLLGKGSHWICTLFSHYDKGADFYPCYCAGAPFSVCIPYNEGTKHLVGTNEEAPECYRYWEEWLWKY